MKEFARVSYRTPEEGIRHLATIINKLINEHPYHDVITVTSNYVADGRYRTILADCTSEAITVTFKSATAIEGGITVKKIDSTGNAVTVAHEGSETADGQTTSVWSAQYDSYTFVSNRANWFIV